MSVGLPTGTLVLSDPDPGWARLFERERSRLQGAVGSNATAVEHIGSTAVQDMLAKPIVDIGILVQDEDAFPECVEPIVALGYQHRGQHGDDPLRRYFVLERRGLRLVHLHIWTRDATAWNEALAFRDALREDPALRVAYTAEKKRAAEHTGWVKSAYSLEKGAFVRAWLDGRLAR